MSEQQSDKKRDDEYRALPTQPLDQQIAWIRSMRDEHVAGVKESGDILGDGTSMIVSILRSLQQLQAAPLPELQQRKNPGDYGHGFGGMQELGGPDNAAADEALKGSPTHSGDMPLPAAAPAEGSTPRTDAIITGGTIGQIALLNHARQLELENSVLQEQNFAMNKTIALSASTERMAELREKIGQAAYEWQQYVDTDHAPRNLVDHMEAAFDAARSATQERKNG